MRHATPAAVLCAAAALLGFAALAPSARTYEPTSATALEEISEMRGEALGYLVVHQEPRPFPTDHPLLDEAGSRTTLAAFEGSVVVLNFWATWCPPCREEMPSLDRLQAELGGADLQVVAVSLDRSAAKARAFFDEHGIRHLNPYLDSRAALANRVNALGLPTTILLDRAGFEIGRLVGEAEWDATDAVSLLRRLIEVTGDPDSALNAGSAPPTTCGGVRCPGPRSDA